MYKSFLYVFFFIVYLITSCRSKHHSINVTSFQPIVNPEFQAKGNTIYLNVDLDNAIVNGIEIPTVTQSKNGYFTFSFTVDNSAEKELYYKIYYQNDTYKISEDSALSNENFYGSWVNTEIEFKKIVGPKSEIKVIDSFKIVGNPRNEKIFFGADLTNYKISDELIQEKIDSITKNPDWMAQVKVKAIEQKISVNEQIYLDALWAVDHARNADKSANNRWKRNPRMGNYKFMLIVTSDEDLKNIPSYIKDISKLDTNGTFVNPFNYFLFQDEKKLKSTVALISDLQLNVKTKFDLGAGIFINKTMVNKSVFTKDFYSSICGENSKLFKKAQFQQYFHTINRDFPLKNISEVKDVVGDNFTRQEYNELKSKYEKSNHFVNTYVNSSDCPCKTVISDSIQHSITLINPGSTENNLKKEQVGIMGRIGTTYGKWRAKIKFPELLSRDNVWNGLTNAFWLLSQEMDASWNLRRPCNSEIAYIPKNEADNNSALTKSKKQVGYSEIDFEILKESQYWPKTSYNGTNNFPQEDASNTSDITVTCTNWDLACHEPKDFNIGAFEHRYDNLSFIHHRWDHWYKALTTKVPEKNKELFGKDYYYFEIEWLPNKIIWRIGPEKDQLKIVCIMDNTVSAIPNNQMVAILTQEFHNQEWWPTAPYKQNFVPFPKKDIIGKVFQIEIE